MNKTRSVPKVSRKKMTAAAYADANEGVLDEQLGRLIVTAQCSISENAHAFHLTREALRKALRKAWTAGRAAAVRDLKVSP